jgi:hypothetical protein
MKRAFFLTIVIFVAAIADAQAQRVAPIVRVPVEIGRGPVLVVPEGTAIPALPELKNPQVVTVPQGAVVVVEPPVAEASPSGDCTVAQEECASSCYPLPSNWATYRECLTGLCKIQGQNCIEALLDRLE